MIRLHLIVEGQTEETFVNEVLKDHLSGCGVFPSVRSVETSRRRARIYRGGLIDYGRARRDLKHWMKEDRRPEVRFSTMFDLFRLPEDFPGQAEARKARDPYRRVRALEQAFYDDVADRCFVPYIQVHEFEALLFADPEQLLVMFPGAERAVQALVEVTRSFKSPEHVNDGNDTAPSKRIGRVLPRYAREKVSAGPAVARCIGLATLRERCHHFGEWLDKLETLEAAESSP